MKLNSMYKQSLLNYIWTNSNEIIVEHLFTETEGGSWISVGKHTAFVCTNFQASGGSQLLPLYTERRGTGDTVLLVPLL